MSKSKMGNMVTVTAMRPVSFIGHVIRLSHVTVTRYRYGLRNLNRLTFPMFYALFSMLFFVFDGQVFAQTDLKMGVPDVCYQCHIKLKEGLSYSYVHSPFKQGKCSACHNPHTSNLKNLIKDEINSLCLSCHEGIRKALKKENVHGALRRGLCTDCHYAHSGENKHLLVKAEKKLCYDCHEVLKEQLKRPYAHLPFKEGECSSCHNPHASSEENQLLTAPNKICKNCHAPRCKAGGVSISFATEKLDCTECHTGHSSNTKGLLGPYGHAAFLDKRCGECHNPILSNREITTRIAGSDLCFNCHKKDPAKFREADIHGSEKVSCALCHNYHASKKKNLTIKESRLCFTCHENTKRRTVSMEKALKSIRCVPIKDRRCFECHIPLHSSQPYYFRVDKILTCARCHKVMHEVTHPIGNEVIDPRNGQPMTCITCHSMHSAKAEFMLVADRKRTLCIQCHKK